MDIDKEMISKLKYNDIETINQKIIDNTITENIESKLSNYIKNDKNSKIGKNIIESISNLKKIFVAYKIFKSFYNFIAHILDKN